MAKIRRIGNDHQAPFQVVFLLFLYQVVTRGENKLPHGQYTSDPQYSDIFWTPYKMTSRGGRLEVPQPLNPPYRGGQSIFWGGYY